MTTYTAIFINDETNNPEICNVVAHGMYDAVKTLCDTHKVRRVYGTGLYRIVEVASFNEVEKIIDDLVSLRDNPERLAPPDDSMKSIMRNVMASKGVPADIIAQCMADMDD